MDKIIFRQLKPSDFKEVFDWVKKIEKEDTYIIINSNEPMTLKEEKEYFKDLFKKIKQKKLVRIGVFNGKKYLGSCEIEKQGRRQGHVGSLGIALSKNFRGQGIGKKLVQMTIDLAKKRLGLKLIVLSCFANNKIGLRFYRYLGFRQCGRQPDSILYKGEFIDTIRFYKKL